jgi:AcrR family transcriptional regulator
MEYWRTAMSQLLTPDGESSDNKKISRRAGAGRPRKMGADSATKIKDAATRLFARKGFSNTTLDDIAKDIGITKGGIYYYFNSKEKLLLSILDDIESRSIDKTSRAMAASSESSLGQLMLFSKFQAIWAMQHPSDMVILSLTSLNTVNDRSKAGDRVRAFYSKMENLITGAIDNCKASGEIRLEIDTQNIMLSMIAIHDGNILLWYRSGCDLETGRVLASIFNRTLLDLIKPSVANPLAHG